MNIVVLDGYTENPGDLSWESLAALGDLRVYERTESGDVLPRIGGAEAVYTNKTPLDRDVLRACPGLRFIGVLATGYNVVDVEAAAELGITVCNIPSYGTRSVAQYTFALLLALCHHVELHSRAVFAGEWTNQPDFSFWKTPLVELAGKTLGIVGFGRIGQNVARIGAAFGMDILAYDAFPARPPEGTPGRLVSLEALLAESDVVSLHCPLTPENRGMINAGALGRMKATAFLLNTARGPLIVEEDLAEALEAGALAGAALDVVETEPILPANPLLRARNCLITPHIAWATREARGRLMEIAVENLRAFLAGRPVHTVTP